MAKVGMIERDKKRKKLGDKYAKKRAELKAIIHDRTKPQEERFQAVLDLSELPKNSAKIRQRNRCAITGRPRGYHRQFGLCRNVVRELAQTGELPGVVKSSW